MTRLRIGLVVSLLLNLFLAGALVAGYMTVRTGKGMIAGGSLRIAGSELPRATRRPFRRALRETRQAMRPTILASRQAKAEAAELLRQPVVDQVAVNAALDRARAADISVRAAVERRAVGFAAGLPPSERATLADAMRKRGAIKNRD